MAAITDVDFCEDNKELAYKVNTEFPLLVSKYLNQLRINIILFKSQLIKFIVA